MQKQPNFSAVCPDRFERVACSDEQQKGTVKGVNCCYRVVSYFAV